MRQAGLQAFFNSKSFQLLLIAGYGLVWGLLLPYYRYRLYSDTFSYLDLARHYLHGDLHEALNGYWAPLISWLLVPLLGAGLDALLSFKILTMLSGLLALLGARHLMQLNRVLPLVQACMLAALVPLLAWFALQVSTPDLLSAALLLFYLAEAQRLVSPGEGLDAASDHPGPLSGPARQPGAIIPRLSGWQASRRQSLLVGALAAGAYLAKNYNFFFVAAHLAGLCLFLPGNKAGRQNRRQELKRLGLAALFFLLLAGCWMLPISLKYGRLTAGTAGRFNVNLAAPASQGFPYQYQGLIPPPHARSWHSWEDPSLYQLPAWQPWASVRDLAFEVHLLGQNIMKYLALAGLNLPLLPVIVLLALWFFLASRQPQRRHLGFSLFAFLLYPLGYWLIYLEQRHIWINIILGFILTAQVLSCLLRQARLWQQGLLLAVVTLALVNQPVRDLYDHRFVNQRQFRLQAQALEGRLALTGKRLATRHGNWHQGLFLSFFTRSRFYGATPAGATGQALSQSLRRHHIDYYLVWGPPEAHPDHLFPVVQLPDQELTVYRVR